MRANADLTVESVKLPDANLTIKAALYQEIG